MAVWTTFPHYSARGVLRRLFTLSSLGLWSLSVPAQRAEVRPADPVRLPAINDSNSPVYWWDGEFRVFQSDGRPKLSRGSSQFDVLEGDYALLRFEDHHPIWIESVDVDDDGALYAWYHHEQVVCDGRLSIPKIGALVSHDGGEPFSDLGIVLDSGAPENCEARNGYFASGHGDFSVLLDSSRSYFYIYFGNHSGPESSQGVAVARMAYADREYPVGQVWKFFKGGWSEPGLGRRVTAFRPAMAAWERPDADAFWGPSLHWNTYLGQYVMLLNRACCEPRFPNEGADVSFNPDLSNLLGWTQPAKILDAGYCYPQVIGLEPGGTGREAGRVARFYTLGRSNFEIVFESNESLEAPAPLRSPRGGPTAAHQAPASRPSVPARYRTLGTVV